MTDNASSPTPTPGFRALWQRLLAIWGTVSALLAGVALFRIFGPLVDLPQWIANIVLAYDTVIRGPALWLLSHLELDVPGPVADALILAVLGTGVLLRAVGDADRATQLAYVVVAALLLFWLTIWRQILGEDALIIVFLLSPIAITVLAMMAFIRGPDLGRVCSSPSITQAFRRYLLFETGVVGVVAGGLFLGASMAVFGFG